MGFIPAILAALGINKAVAWLIEVAIVTALVAGVSFYIAGLRNKAGALDRLTAERTSLEEKYGCGERPSVAERDLAACLVARDLDAEQAKVSDLARATAAARQAQYDLDHANDLTWTQLLHEDAIIHAAPKSDDGRVPKVLLDAWTRQRKLMGVTK